MLRVIAGELRGRRLVTPDGWSTRPTKGRIRESLFDLLAGVPDGARVLDLYAGSGALGIEALSRGARHAVFVESARAALRALRQNLETLGLAARATVVAGDALAGSPAARGPYDLVLADPPYEAGVEEAVVAEAAKRLAPGGVLALEHAADRPAPEPPSGLAVWKARRYGGTSLTLYVRVAEETS
jgi:16S rRNA (guanine(966)-N(2))-methyltransferase RsmD